MNLRAKAVYTFITLVTFVLTQVMAPVQGLAVTISASPNSELPSSFEFSIPSNLGTIEELIPGNDQTLVHIQTAHGNYEAQKNIQEILHYLKDNYGFDTLLLEGSASKLRPEIMRLYPDRMDVTMEIADRLTKKALVKGPGLFLLEAPDVVAYGIEDVDSYVRNGVAFKAVLKQKDATENFLRDMDMQIERLISPYLNKDLRAFLSRLEDFEQKRIPIEQWLGELKKQAYQLLRIDLSSPNFQLDWPMLVRVFKLQEFEKKIDARAYAKERKAFLKSIKKTLPTKDYTSIEKLLTSPLSRHQLASPDTAHLFERMVASLPENFKVEKYGNVSDFIGHLILQSEIKGEMLMDEIASITDKVTDQLAKTEMEKKIVELLKDHRLLHKLFGLELTPNEYETILSRGSEILPVAVIERFLALNGNSRVKNVAFKNIDAITLLFTTAMNFYETVKERDLGMLANAENRMRELGVKKAVVVTGGFHAEPFRNYFASKHFNYALITPNITSLDGLDAYHESVLHQERNIFQAQTRETVWAYYQDLPGLRVLGADSEDLLDQAADLSEVNLSVSADFNFNPTRFNQTEASRVYGVTVGRANNAVELNVVPVDGGFVDEPATVSIELARKRTVRDQLVPDFGSVQGSIAASETRNQEKDSKLVVPVQDAILKLQQLEDPASQAAAEELREEARQRTRDRLTTEALRANQQAKSETRWRISDYADLSDVNNITNLRSVLAFQLNGPFVSEVDVTLISTINRVKTYTIRAILGDGTKADEPINTVVIAPDKDSLPQVEGIADGTIGEDADLLYYGVYRGDISKSETRWQISDYEDLQEIDNRPSGSIAEDIRQLHLAGGVEYDSIDVTKLSTVNRVKTYQIIGRNSEVEHEIRMITAPLSIDLTETIAKAEGRRDLITGQVTLDDEQLRYVVFVPKSETRVNPINVNWTQLPGVAGLIRRETINGVEVFSNVQNHDGLWANDDLMVETLREKGFLGLVTTNQSIAQKKAPSWEPVVRQHARDGVTPVDSFLLAYHEEAKVPFGVLKNIRQQSGGVLGQTSQEASAMITTEEGLVDGTNAIDELSGFQGEHSFVKLPNIEGETPGLPHFEQAGPQAAKKRFAEGKSGNITLGFSVDHYIAFVQAHIEGLEARVEEVKDAYSDQPDEEVTKAIQFDFKNINWVFSLFMSRIDRKLVPLFDQAIEKAQKELDSVRGRSDATALIEKLEKRIDELRLLRGKTSVALGRFTAQVMQTVYFDQPLNDRFNFLTPNQKSLIQRLKRRYQNLRDAYQARPLYVMLASSGRYPEQDYASSLQYVLPFFGTGMWNTIPGPKTTDALYEFVQDPTRNGQTFDLDLIRERNMVQEKIPYVRQNGIENGVSTERWDQLILTSEAERGVESRTASFILKRTEQELLINQSDYSLRSLRSIGDERRDAGAKGFAEAEVQMENLIRAWHALENIEMAKQVSGADGVLDESLLSTIRPSVQEIADALKDGEKVKVATYRDAVSKIMGVVTDLQQVAPPQTLEHLRKAAQILDQAASETRMVIDRRDFLAGFVATAAAFPVDTTSGSRDARRTPETDVERLLANLQVEDVNTRVDAANDIKQLISDRRVALNDIPELVSGLVDALSLADRAVDQSALAFIQPSITRAAENTVRSTLESNQRLITSIQAALVSAKARAVRPALDRLRQENVGALETLALVNTLDEVEANQVTVELGQVLVDTIDRLERIADEQNLIRTSALQEATRAIVRTLTNFNSVEAVPALVRTAEVLQVENETSTRTLELLTEVLNAIAGLLPNVRNGQLANQAQQLLRNRTLELAEQLVIPARAEVDVDLLLEANETFLARLTDQRTQRDANRPQDIDRVLDRAIEVLENVRRAETRVTQLVPVVTGAQQGFDSPFGQNQAVQPPTTANQGPLPLRQILPIVNPRETQLDNLLTPSQLPDFNLTTVQNPNVIPTLVSGEDGVPQPITNNPIGGPAIDDLEGPLQLISVTVPTSEIDTGDLDDRLLPPNVELPVAFFDPRTQNIIFIAPQDGLAIPGFDPLAILDGINADPTNVQVIPGGLTTFFGILGDDENGVPAFDARFNQNTFTVVPFTSDNLGIPAGFQNGFPTEDAQRVLNPFNLLQIFNLDGFDGLVQFFQGFPGETGITDFSAPVIATTIRLNFAQNLPALFNINNLQLPEQLEGVARNLGLDNLATFLNPANFDQFANQAAQLPNFNLDDVLSQVQDALLPLGLNLPEGFATAPTALTFEDLAIAPELIPSFGVNNLLDLINQLNNLGIAGLANQFEGNIAGQPVAPNQAQGIATAIATALVNLVPERINLAALDLNPAQVEAIEFATGIPTVSVGEVANLTPEQITNAFTNQDFSVDTGIENLQTAFDNVGLNVPGFDRPDVTFGQPFTPASIPGTTPTVPTTITGVDVPTTPTVPTLPTVPGVTPPTVPPTTGPTTPVTPDTFTEAYLDVAKDYTEYVLPGGFNLDPAGVARYFTTYDVFAGFEPVYTAQGIGADQLYSAFQQIAGATGDVTVIPTENLEQDIRAAYSNFTSDQLATIVDTDRGLVKFVNQNQGDALVTLLWMLNVAAQSVSDGGEVEGIYHVIVDTNTAPNAAAVWEGIERLANNRDQQNFARTKLNTDIPTLLAAAKKLVNISVVQPNELAGTINEVSQASQGAGVLLAELLDIDSFATFLLEDRRIQRNIQAIPHLIMGLHRALTSLKGVKIKNIQERYDLINGVLLKETSIQLEALDRNGNRVVYRITSLQKISHDLVVEQMIAVQA